MHQILHFKLIVHFALQFDLGLSSNFLIAKPALYCSSLHWTDSFTLLCPSFSEKEPILSSNFSLYISALLPSSFHFFPISTAIHFLRYIFCPYAGFSLSTGLRVTMTVCMHTVDLWTFYVHITHACNINMTTVKRICPWLWHMHRKGFKCLESSIII